MAFNEAARSNSIVPTLRNLGGIFISGLTALVLVTGAGLAQGGAVVIGAMYNLTGPQQSLDVPSSEGARLAVAGLIGFSDTDMVLASAPIAARHRRVFLTSGATTPTQICLAVAQYELH